MAVSGLPGVEFAASKGLSTLHLDTAVLLLADVPTSNHSFRPFFLRTRYHSNSPVNGKGANRTKIAILLGLRNCIQTLCCYTVAELVVSGKHGDNSACPDAFGFAIKTFMLQQSELEARTDVEVVTCLFQRKFAFCKGFVNKLGVISPFGTSSPICR